MTNHIGYHEYHARVIHEFRDRQQSGLETRREELTRIYEREMASDRRFPRTFEEFASSDQYRVDYSRWMGDRQGWLVNVEKRVLDYERSIQDYTHKGRNDIHFNTSMAIRSAMAKQDFAGTRQLGKYTFLDHPKLTLSAPPTDSELRAVQEYSWLTESCAKEVARRQHELPAVLAETLSLVKREMSNLRARIDPVGKEIKDPNERQRFLAAAEVHNFEEVTRKAEELLKDWTNLLDRDNVSETDMLNVMGRGETLENLHKLAIDLWPGLIQDMAPNTTYRLPALTAMIGRQIGEQLYARAGSPTYQRAMMRLAEVPIRGATLHTSWGTDSHAFQSQIDKWFKGIEQSLSSQGKQELAGLAREVKQHQFNDAFYAARQALQTKNPGPVTGVNSSVYDAVATLATSARELRALVEKRIAGTDSPAMALEHFDAVLDDAISSIKDRLQVRAGETLASANPLT
jgi:hypothetical protein